MHCEICGKDMLYETLGSGKELDYYIQSKSICYTCKKLNNEERENLKKKYHKKNVLRNLSIFLFICVLISLIPLWNLYSDYKHNQRMLESIYTSLSNYSSIIKNYEFIDGYNMKLNLELHEHFDELTQQEKFEYIEGMLNSRENMLYRLQKININFYTASHTYSLINTTLFRDGNIYKKEDANFEYFSAFIKNSNYEDSNELITMLESMKYQNDIIEFCEETSSGEHFREEIIYKYATTKMKDCSFKEAIDAFGKIESYRDSKEMINKCNICTKYVGTWESPNSSNTQIIFNLDELYTVTTYYNSRYVYVYSYTIQNNVLKTKTSTYELKENTLVEYNSENGKTETYTKISDNHIKPKEYRPKEPAIGMTAAEVRASTWGNPNKINRTTTIYGTREQWCYSNNKFIHFNENGYVSSIDEY
ncbi:MAG: hypothetical protein J6B87_02765 [Clostridia bacterium]|nr:hypothetical protein [Clostridia bacterium]